MRLFLISLFSIIGFTFLLSIEAHAQTTVAVNAPQFKVTIPISLESIHDGCLTTIGVEDYIDCLYSFSNQDLSSNVSIEVLDDPHNLVKSVKVTETGDLFLRYNTFYDKSGFDIGLANTSYLGGVKQLLADLDADYFQIKIVVTYSGDKLTDVGLPVEFNYTEGVSIREVRDAADLEE